MNKVMKANEAPRQSDIVGEGQTGQPSGDRRGEHEDVEHRAVAWVA